jgi:catechol-2,3-dioxygenase
MIQARRLGHATFDTPDLQRQLEYYTDVVGLQAIAREKDRVFLASRIGHIAVELRKAADPNCTKLSFEVAPDTDFGAVARELSSLGIASDLRSDNAPGTPKSLAFKDPKGTAIELFTEWKAAGDSQGAAVGIAPHKIGHVAFQVTDVQGIVDFYSRVLGFRISDWIDDWFAFMRCNSDHHTVNFITGPSNQLHHAAFALQDWSQVKTVCDFLSWRNISIIWGPLRHGPGHNIAIYFRDADDNILETYIDLDQMPDEALGYFEPRPWHRDRPQRPKVWVGRASGKIWGPPPTPDFQSSRREQAGANS